MLEIIGYIYLTVLVFYTVISYLNRNKLPLGFRTTHFESRIILNKFLLTPNIFISEIISLALKGHISIQNNSQEIILKPLAPSDSLVYKLLFKNSNDLNISKDINLIKQSYVDLSVYYRFSLRKYLNNYYEKTSAFVLLSAVYLLFIPFTLSDFRISLLFITFIYFFYIYYMLYQNIYKSSLFFILSLGTFAALILGYQYSLNYLFGVLILCLIIGFNNFFFKHFNKTALDMLIINKEFNYSEDLWEKLSSLKIALENPLNSIFPRSKSEIFKDLSS
jgi:hypothetical protein